MKAAHPFLRIFCPLLALVIAAAPRAGEAFPFFPSSHRTYLAPKTDIALPVATGVTRDTGDAAPADSAALDDASPSGLYAPVLGGGLALRERHSGTPYLAAGLAIAMVAAPAILLGGFGGADYAVSDPAPGYHSLRTPVTLPHDPEDGMIDPPALDLSPAAVGTGPADPAPEPDALPVREPVTAALLAAGLLALGASLRRQD